MNLFAHQHDLACAWTRPTAPPAPEAPVVLTRDAPPAKVEAPADEAPDAPVVLTRDAPATDDSCHGPMCSSFAHW